MKKPRLLFTAPYDFDPGVMAEYEQAFDMHSLGQPEVWVPNPNMDYMIDDNALNMYPLLRYVATPSTGTNHINMVDCGMRNIKVLSLLDDRVGLNEISASAEFTFKMILDALRLDPPRELQGKLVGIVGFGRIGKRVDAWCRAFGAKTMFYDVYVGSLPFIFMTCDVVVVSCSLNEQTKGMITADLLRNMKQGAALVNTARGEVIDEDGLVEVMKERPDLKVAVDVLVGETSGTQNPDRLRRLGAIVTPHIAGATYDSRTKAARIILDLIRKEYGI